MQKQKLTVTSHGCHVAGLIPTIAHRRRQPAPAIILHGHMHQSSHEYMLCWLISVGSDGHQATDGVGGSEFHTPDILGPQMWATQIKWASYSFGPSRRNFYWASSCSVFRFRPTSAEPGGFGALNSESHWASLRWCSFLSRWKLSFFYAKWGDINVWLIEF